MNTLDPGAPLRSLSPTTIQDQRAERVSRAAKPARVAGFTLDSPEHSGTIHVVIGGIPAPSSALNFNRTVMFTLNQHNSNSVGSRPRYSTSTTRKFRSIFSLSSWSRRSLAPRYLARRVCISTSDRLHRPRTSLRSLAEKRFSLLMIRS